MLIAINVIAWLLYQLPDLDQSVIESAFYPCAVSGCPDPLDFDPSDRPFIPQPGGAGWIADAFTSMFMHGSWIHIIGNMLFLWIFGNNVEDRMGRPRFIVFYLAAGLAATALQSAITLEFGQTIAGVNIDALIPTVGASGRDRRRTGCVPVALPARTGACDLLHRPDHPVREVPAFFFLGGWFVFQLWQGGFDLLSPDGGTGGVAFFAHIGGFIFGFLAVKLFTATPRIGRRREPDPPWAARRALNASATERGDQRLSLYGLART